jgi:hypothetical protein
MKRKDFVAGTALLAAPGMVQTQVVNNGPDARPVRIIQLSQSGGAT